VPALTPLRYRSSGVRLMRCGDGESRSGGARHFVRAMPDWCAPCPFRARRARFGILTFLER